MTPKSMKKRPILPPRYAKKGQHSALFFNGFGWANRRHSTKKGRAFRLELIRRQRCFSTYENNGQTDSNDPPQKAAVSNRTLCEAPLQEDGTGKQCDTFLSYTHDEPRRNRGSCCQAKEIANCRDTSRLAQPFADYLCLAVTGTTSFRVTGNENDNATAESRVMLIPTERQHSPALRKKRYARLY